MIRPTVARVDLSAIRANCGAIADFLARGSRTPPRVIAVVKANAYGHGAKEVGLALEAAGASMLACADIEEGIVLRDAGVRAPILVFGALSVSDLDGIFTHDLTPTISTPSAARALEAAAARHDRVLGCHLKIDTGMNRLGFRHDNLDRTIPNVAAYRHLRIDAIYSHFATADDPEHPMFAVQRERFESACARLAALGISAAARHAANSAALLRDERVWYDYVRPGLLLYGVVPPPLAATLPLVPALSLHSRIVAVKGIRPGEASGYGLRQPVSTPTTVAVVPAGYADGLDMRLSGRGFMLVRGRRAPIVGSVCMDMTLVDVTGTDVAPGDEVVIVGHQGAESIGMREIAAAIGTIPYELLCRVGLRIERIRPTQSRIPNPPSDANPQSSILNPESPILNPQSPIGTVRAPSGGMAKKPEELPVFEKVQEFCVAVTAILERPALRRNRSLHKQLDEANDSIISNMHEGFAKGSDAGSLAEVLARLERARSKGYITGEELATRKERGEEIARMLGGWIKYLDRSDFKDRGRFRSRSGIRD